MAVFLVTWNLNKEKPNYDDARRKFVGRLDQYETIRDPGLESVRFVSTSLSAESLGKDLKNYLDSNDRLVVTKFSGVDHYGWLHESVWKWIDARS